MLVRFPGLLASLTAGALLLALAAASYPLFISSASSEALARQVAIATRYGSGIRIGQETGMYPYGNLIEGPVKPLFRKRDTAVRERFGAIDTLGPVVGTVLGPVVTGINEDRPQRTIPFRVIGRTQALEHVRVTGGRDAGGVWIADLPAGHLKVGPGDTIDVSFTGYGGDQRTLELEIDGTYRALFNEPPDPYWRALSREIYPEGDAGAPPTFLIADPEQAIDIADHLRVEAVTQSWEAPLRSGPVTLEEAHALERTSVRLDTELRREGSALGRAFCFDCFGGSPSISSLISQVVSLADRRIAPVQGPVRLLLVAGILVAVTVVAAAGAFALATRRVETNLLFARGMSPLLVAVKTCLESVLPALLGAALGLGAAVTLVDWIGPGGTVDPSAMRTALFASALAVPAAIVLPGVVAAVSFMRRSESGTERLGRLGRIPWEIAFLAVALFFLWRLFEGGALVRDASGITRPSIFLLLFPILFIAGFGGLIARGFVALLTRFRGRSGGLSAAAYLVVHRLVSAPRLSVLLFTAAALTLGIFVHSLTIVRSIETTVDAKALLFVGSDVQAFVNPDQEIPDDFPFPATKATRLLDAGGAFPGDVEVDLLAVDPATLPRAAYWNSRFGASSLEELMSELQRSSEPLPAILANGELPGVNELRYFEERVPIEIVEEVETFPGTSSKRPLLVMSAPALESFFSDRGQGPLDDPRASPEVWATGDTDRVVAAMAPLEPFGIITAQEVKDIPSISAVIDTFGVLNVLGFGAGFLVIVVMLMYLQARQRGRVIAYALSRRMGLSDESHGWSLVLELATMLIIAYAIGSALAITSARMIVGMVDPLAAIPPSSLFTLPALLMGAALAVLAVVSFAGGTFTNRRAGRVDFAEVMRLAE